MLVVGTERTWGCDTMVAAGLAIGVGGEAGDVVRAGR